MVSSTVVRNCSGDQTRLQNGETATTGFGALGDLDTNADTIIDAGDATFSQLKIWQDLNQDGVSQADELRTLADCDIAAINLSSNPSSWKQNGNAIASTGTFVRTDATIGTVADVSLATNLAAREFTDQIETAEAIAALP